MRIAVEVGDAGEADRAGFIDFAQHFVTLRGSSDRRSVSELLVVLGEVSTSVRRNEHVAVVDIDESVVARDLHRLSREGSSHVIAKAQHRHATLVVDHSRQTLARWGRLFVLHRAVDHLEVITTGKLEASRRHNVTE